jgi:hypothetical protein
MKYKLSDVKTMYLGRTLYRVKALRSFQVNGKWPVTEGELGGWVEHTDNLSQNGTCWIGGDARVYGGARVTDDAHVFGESHVYDVAHIADRAIVCDKASVFQHAQVYEDAQVVGDARAYGIAEIHGKAKVIDRARCYQRAWVYGDVVVNGNANITEKTTLDPVVIQGLRYTVTIMDEHISFDCESATIKEWVDMTTKEIISMDGKEAAVFDKKYRPMILAMLQTLRPQSMGNV